MFKDLTSFLKKLEKEDEIVHVNRELSSVYEIPAAVKYLTRHKGKAVFFDRVKGYPVPVAANLLGSRRRLAMALGVKEEALDRTYQEGRHKRVAPRMLSKAPVQEVVVDKAINITRVIPVLTHHYRDAGPYMTCAITMAKDPETGIRGMGIHRIQVKGPDKIAIFLASPPLSFFLAKAEKLGKPLEVAVVSGADLVTLFASCLRIPEGLDKLETAGGLGGVPIELVKCKSVDLEVPAHAQFVLEGKLAPKPRQKEGPFGESTGYYFSFDNPVATIEVISHRRSPVYHALMPFGPEEEMLLSLPGKLDTLEQIRSALPQVQNLVLRGLGQIAIVQIDKKSDDDARKLFDLLFASPTPKIVIVVDTDVDISDPAEVDWALATRLRPDKGVTVRPGLPGFGIDPSASVDIVTKPVFSRVVRTAKLGIDATKPLAELARFEKVDLPPEVKQKIDKLMRGLFPD